MDLLLQNGIDLVLGSWQSLITFMRNHPWISYRMPGSCFTNRQRPWMPGTPWVNQSVSVSTTAKGTWSSERYWSSPQYLHSAKVIYYALSKICGVGGMHSRVYLGYTKIEKVHGTLWYCVHQAHKRWTWDALPQDWTGPFTSPSSHILLYNRASRKWYSLHGQS